MYQLTLSIDPSLSTRGARIAWAWRTLLVGIGYAWREVPFGSPADLCYSAGPPPAPARLTIRADPARWAEPGAWRLDGIATQPGPAAPGSASPQQWPHPRYRGERPDATPLLQHGPDGAQIARDLIFDLFWLLTGQEEPHLPRNKHGHLDLGLPPAPHAVAPRMALASQIGSEIAQTLRQLGAPPPVPRWPHGKRAAAAASHDVDYPEVIRWLEPLRVLRRQGMAGISNALSVASGRRHHWHFQSWMALETELGSPSAFYFVPRQGSLPEYALGTPDPFYNVSHPRLRQALADLADHGWEVGLHASYRAWEQPDGIARERATLEEAAGRPVLGNRHHYWHTDPLLPEATLLAHERAGLLYDASLAHDRYMGWRRGTCWPFYPFHQGLGRPLRTLQLPTGWMDAHSFLRHAENPGEPMALLQDLAETALEQGGLLLINIHDYVFDDALFPGWTRAYADLWRHIGAGGAFWMATPAAIARHWAERQAAIEQESAGLD